MIWVGHAARMKDRKGQYRDFVGRHQGKNHLEEIDVDGRIILSLIFKKWDTDTWTGLAWLSI